MIVAEHVDKMEVLRRFLEREWGGPLPTVPDMKRVFGAVMGVEGEELDRLFEEAVGSAGAKGRVWIQPYRRVDGTAVAGYWRETQIADRAPEISDLLFGGKLDPENHNYHSLDWDGEWLIGGGCAHLAIAMKEVFPEGKIAAAWYDDHGRRALSHAVFYDPKTGHAWDGVGTWDDFDTAVRINGGITEVDPDAQPIDLAEHQGINYDPEYPFANEGIMLGWEFAERWFLPAEFQNPDHYDDET